MSYIYYGSGSVLDIFYTVQVIKNDNKRLHSENSDYESRLMIKEHEMNKIQKEFRDLRANHQELKCDVSNYF